MNYYSIREKKSFIEKIRGFSVVTWLIIINVIFSILAFILFAISDKYINYLALTPSNILQGKYLWTLLTHMFVHGSALHLFVNMFSLWFVGRLVEKIIGKKRFFWIYLISGLFAGIFSVLVAGFFGIGIWEKILGNPIIPAVGASGALFGIVGVLVAILPNTRVFLIAGPIIAIILQTLLETTIKSTTISGILNLIITFYIIFCVFSMFSFNSRNKKIIIPIEMPFWILPIAAIVPLVVLSLFIEMPIGNMAHLGGFLAGLAYGLYLRQKYKRKVLKLQQVFK